MRAGQLTEEEMAALLKMLEAANLRECCGDYLPEAACEKQPDVRARLPQLFWRIQGAQPGRRSAGLVSGDFERLG